MVTNLDINKICRMCCQMSRNLKDIFNKNGKDLSKIVFDVTRIRVMQSDVLPKKICFKCYRKIQSTLEFRKKCKFSNISLRLLFNNLIKKDEKIWEPNEEQENFWNKNDRDPISFFPHEVNSEFNEISCKEENEDCKDDFLVSFGNCQMNESAPRIEPTEHVKVETFEQNNDNEDKESEKTFVSENVNVKKKKINLKRKIGEKESQRIESMKERKKYPTAAYLSPCHICGKLYQNGLRMKYHLNGHNNIRPFVCNVDGCKADFHNPQHMKQHQKYIHFTDMIKIKCDICGKMLKGKCSLDMHKSYHGDPTIPCEICGKLFRNQRTIKKHMMVHTGKRPYPCNKCDKSFSNSYNLKRHLRVHTKEKPFPCTECNDSFSHKTSLKVHLERHKIK